MPSLEQLNVNDDSKVDPSECDICYDDLSADVDMMIYLDCGHVMCHTCLNECVARGLSSRAAFPPRCCENSSIDILSLSDHIDEENMIRFILVEEEFSERSPLYCTRPSCNLHIPQNCFSNSTMQFVMCNDCQEETCLQCRAAYGEHWGEMEDGSLLCPDLMTQEDRELVGRSTYLVGLRFVARD